MAIFKIMLSYNDPSKNPFHLISASSYNARYMYYVETEKALRELHSLRIKLLTLPFMLDNEGYVRPVECDQVVDILKKINRTVKKISGKLILLNESLAISGSYYYKTLMYLYSASDKSGTTSEVIRQYRSICLDPTTQQRKTFTEAHKEVLEIVRACENAEQDADKLLDTLRLNPN